MTFYIGNKVVVKATSKAPYSDEWAELYSLKNYNPSSKPTITVGIVVAKGYSGISKTYYGVEVPYDDNSTQTFVVAEQDLEDYVGKIPVMEAPIVAKAPGKFLDIGQKVFVSNSGECYTSYTPWAIMHNIVIEQIVHPKNGEFGIIVARGYHLSRREVLYGVKIDKRTYIFAEDGLIGVNDAN